MKNLMSSLVLLTISSALAGCFNSKSSSLAADNPSPELNVFDTNLYPLNKVSCDPFDPGSNPGPNDGLVARLYYRGAGQTRWYNSQDYINQGVKSQQYLFFSSLEVPTRKFDLGFPKETGGSVQNDQGENLMEFFALSFASVLKLAPEDEEGTYELALLSDDGALFKVRNANGVYETLVSNDGDHPTRMGCGQTLNLSRESEHMVQIDYYQGPRFHISLIPMWRKVTANTQTEPNCGRSGNSLFFDYNNNSAPQQAYRDLLSRGWKPIAAGNWHLPAFSLFNPCTQGTLPTISNFRLVSQIEGTASFAWDTDIPATSQILIKNLTTGEERLTLSDNRLRAQHLVVLTDGLTIGHRYQFKAVSISADYGKAQSATIELTLR